MGYRRYLIEGVLSVENSTQLVDLDSIDVPQKHYALSFLAPGRGLQGS